MVECHEAALEFLVTHKQLSEAIEPAMADLDNPAPRLFVRIAPQDVSFATPANDVRDVAVLLNGAKVLDPTVARVGAQMFVSSTGRVLALDDDGAKDVIKPLAVVDVGPAHDERQRDATTVHQQVALAAFFSPDPSGWDPRLLVPAALSSWRHPHSASARRCLPSGRTRPILLATGSRKSLRFPIPESVCGWRWRCQSALWAAPSTGNPCAARRQSPRTPVGPAWAAGLPPACARRPCPWPDALVPTALRVAKTHRLPPTNQLASSPWPQSNAAAPVRLRSIDYTNYG